MITCPKGERGWITYYSRDHEPRFFLTSKGADRSQYILYEVTGSALRRLGKGRTPRELEEKFRIEERLVE